MMWSFHLYGFIVGSATIIGVLLAEYRYQLLVGKANFSAQEKNFWTAALMALFSGLIGARLWHLATDWSLYQNSWLAAFAIWNGGLSILGAVVGGVSGVALYLWLTSPHSHFRETFLTFLDISVFGLPVAQAIGRLGNYVNQELFGTPTTLPWGLEIEGVKYHPLWAYEAVVMLLFAGSLWLVDRQYQLKFSLPEIGRGWYFMLYLAYYSLVRFGLDFWRVDKAMVPFFNLGVNQVILLGVMAIISGSWLVKKYRHKFQKSQTVIQVMAGLILFTGGIMGGRQVQNWWNSRYLVSTDLDEVAWILDSQVYYWRSNQQWSAFRLTTDYYSLPWSHPEYRLTDQPQTGKYVIGWWLVRHSFLPWQPVQIQTWSHLFLQQASLQTLPPREMVRSLDETMIAALLVTRNLTASVGLLAIFFVGGLTAKKWGIGAGMITCLILLFHPHTTNFFRLATPDSLSFLFLISASFMQVTVFSRHLKSNPGVNSLVAMIAGILTGVAATIKLNGFFLFVFPLVPVILFSLDSKFRVVSLKKLSIRYAIFLLSGIPVFIWLEPEIWFQPVKGFTTLIGSRLLQQERFYQAFGQLSTGETLQFLVTQYLLVVNNWWQKLFLIFFLVTGWYRLLTQLRETSYGSILSSLFLMWAIAVNVSYADNGFTRYSLVFILINSMVTGIGAGYWWALLPEIGKKIYHVT